eukprot:jgi/Mesvir1/9014/Mv21302-RA.1
MSGWDEGDVFYADQKFTGEEHEGSQLSRHAAQTKFKEFIRNYRPNSEFVYRESLRRNPSALTVKVEDVLTYDAALGTELKRLPAEYLPLFEAAAADVVAGLQSKVDDGSGNTEEPARRDVQVMLQSDEHPVTLRALKSEQISRLVVVPGIVIAAQRAKVKATSITLQCSNCKNTKVIPCKPGLGGAAVPRTCDYNAGAALNGAAGTETKCPLDPYVVLPERSTYVDQQTLKLQENPEDVPVGELPRNILLVVDRSLVQTVVPGTRVRVVGIFSIFDKSGGNKKGARAAVAIRQPYLRVVGIQEHGESSGHMEPTFTAEEELELKQFANQPNVYANICRLIAPSIFGHDNVKKAIACLLMGGSRKRLPDGVRLRGDINVLLLGDPSTAKSQFLKFVEKTAPIAVYTSGKGSSAAGLTASVIKDPGSGEFTLEGGAMVLADGGVVCIDEFDKMRPEDRVAIHEAMEQQTISIAKAGITTVLNSRTSVLAAANPPGGRYDDLKSVDENIDLAATILSRFDLIFIVKDERDHARDMMIARHVLNVHATAATAMLDPEEAQRQQMLKRYIEFCRAYCSPRLSEEASAALQSDYIKIREEMRGRVQGKRAGKAIPITVRQLEAIVRISEALARMEMSPVATEAHVNEALALFEASTIDAAKSGMFDAAGGTEQQREQIQSIKDFVASFCATGVHRDVSALLQAGDKHGFPGPLMNKVLREMVSSGGEYEFTREMKSIRRRALAR